MTKATLSIKVEAASAEVLRNRVTEAVEEILTGKLETQCLSGRGIRVDMTVIDEKRVKKERS
jgi:hypothetical protein